MCRLLRLLVTDTSAETITFALARFTVRGGNVRLAFFDLYDAWAEGRIDGAACSAAPAAAITAGEP